MNTLNRIMLESADGAQDNLMTEFNRHLYRQKRKIWWNDEKNKKHSIVIDKYKSWQSEKGNIRLKQEYREEQKAFRTMQRDSIKQKKNEKIGKINSAFEYGDIKFYTEIDKVKKRPCQVEAKVETLATDYKAIFHEKVFIGKLETINEECEKITQHPDVEKFEMSKEDIEKISVNLFEGYLTKRLESFEEQLNKLQTIEE